MKKWSLYKFVCFIDMGAVSVLIGYYIYTNIKNELSGNAAGNSIFALICAICFTGDILGIQLVNKFDVHHGVGKALYRLLIFVYILTCLLFVSFVAADCSIIRDIFTPDFHLVNYDSVSLTLLCLFSILLLTSLVKTIITLPLIKAIRKNHKAFAVSIDTMGNN